MKAVVSAEVSRRVAVLCTTTSYPKPSKPSVSDFMKVEKMKQSKNKKFQPLDMTSVNCWQAIAEKDEAHSQKNTNRNDAVDREDFPALSGGDCCMRSSALKIPVHLGVSREARDVSRHGSWGSSESRRRS